MVADRPPSANQAVWFNPKDEPLWRNAQSTELHGAGQISIGTAHKEVKVSCHQHIGVDLQFSLPNDSCQAGKEVPNASTVLKYCPSCYPSP